MLVLYLAVTAACSSHTEAMRDDVDPSLAEFSCDEPAESASLEPALPLARVEVLPEGGARLLLPPVGAEPSFQRFTREDARRILQRFHEDLAGLKRRERWVASAAPVLASVRQPGSEEALLKEYTGRYGEPSLPLPDSLRDSPLLMALRLSPQYMPEGIREGAEELFRDPAFLAGVAVSLVVYVASWAAPEPLFTKTFAVGVTVVLVSAFSLAELAHAGGAALRLYQATRDIHTLAKVEEAARYFGRYAGGATLRVLVTVASWGVAKVMPKPVPGGLGRTWAGLKDVLRLPQRFALPQGVGLLEATASSTVRVGMKQGVLFMAGVATGATGASLRSACGDGLLELLGYTWHHLATNKNRISDSRGGPWTPRFELIFAKAGMSLEDDANKVYLLKHAGPHSEAYHTEVFTRLRDAVQTCSNKVACRIELTKELNKIADQVCTPGSRLHRLATTP
ncbi:HNH/ENDO VII superfamily nuclease [Archangium gephyra]|uniref:HNH/ENDO VII superfamily nuclease n=1 Tax=Archangium gephyra TaxID=48 RepID=A0AAC8QHQ3_9BACT|nr:putative lipoprotein [Archangium gephyra]REG29497.1 HNH/ENDO VII superfamily nuclease [Archangium gephyra]